MFPLDAASATKLYYQSPDGETCLTQFLR